MNNEDKLWKEQFKDLKTAADLCIDQITITDGNGVFLKISKDCDEYFGIKEEDMVGKSSFDMEKTGIFNISSSAEVIRRRQKVRFIQTTKANKRIFVTGYPVFDENENIIKVVNISTDITNDEDLERELKDTETKLEWLKNERRKRMRNEENFFGTESKNMKEIRSLVEHFASKDILILLLGDTGVGKSHIAKYIHNISNRNKEPFITINCGAIPHNLLESELFGYEKGSFTGALHTGKPGLFEIADNGTIFLDEIAELPLDLQVKLLTVLEEKKFRRIGGENYIDLKARILVATNKDLSKCVKEGTFREDLYYRINVFPIKIPPLSERVEDIPELIDIFLKSYSNKYETSKKVGPDAYEALLLYKYPGNIRELRNIIERLVIINEDEVITEKDVRKVIKIDNTVKDESKGMEKEEEIEIVPLKKGIEEYEKSLLKATSKKYKTTREQARVLGVDQSIIVRKRQKYSI